jgi:hypothetical protein
MMISLQLVEVVERATVGDNSTFTTWSKSYLHQAKLPNYQSSDLQIPTLVVMKSYSPVLYSRHESTAARIQDD